MTAEEFYKTMWNPLYKGTTHPQFSYIEMMKFAEEYASKVDRQLLIDCVNHCDDIDTSEFSDTESQVDDFISNLQESKEDRIGKGLKSGVITKSDCDYRNQECTNDGETTDGKWVCSKHKRKASADFDDGVLYSIIDSLPMWTEIYVQPLDIENTETTKIFWFKHPQLKPTTVYDKNFNVGAEELIKLYKEKSDSQ